MEPQPRVLAALAACAAAQAAIDAFHQDFATPPYEEYHAAVAALDALPPEELAQLPRVLDDDRAASETRLEAIKAIARRGQLDARRAIERALVDPNLEIRSECLRALVRIAPADALETALWARAEVTTWALGEAADAAFEAHGGDALRAIEASRIDPFQGGKAVWRKLYDLRRDDCARIFVRRLAEGDVEWVLGVAAIVCEKGGEWARAPFDAIGRSRDGRFQRAAAQVLQKIGEGDAIDTMLAALSMRESWSARAIVSAIFAIGRRTRSPVAARVIAATAEHLAAQDALMRELCEAATWEWEIPSRSAILSGLRRALGHPDEKVVASAMKVAHAIRGAEVADGVVSAMGHPRWFAAGLPKAFVAYVRAIGPDAAREVALAVERGLDPSADARDAAVAYVAASQMGALGPLAREHASVLVRALRVGEDRTAAAAAFSLGLIDAPEAHDALLETATTKPPGVAYRAVQALVQRKNARVVEPALAYLRPLLEGAPLGGSDAYCMSACSLEALGAFPSPDGVAALKKALAHADMRIRRDACEALGVAKDASALPLLTEATKDPDLQVRRAAANAIAKIAP